MKELNIKQWYNETYNDSLGEDINPFVSFKDVYILAIQNSCDVYTLLGVADSVIRERVFSQIAKLKGVDYEVIYDQWLNEDSTELISSIFGC